MTNETENQNQTRRSQQSKYQWGIPNFFGESRPAGSKLGITLDAFNFGDGRSMIDNFAGVKPRSLSSPSKPKATPPKLRIVRIALPEENDDEDEDDDDDEDDDEE